jgi:hypothetical protein
MLDTNGWLARLIEWSGKLSMAKRYFFVGA